MSQSERVRAFRSMHAREEILVLLNAWDAGSARILENSGARAIGTTSMGIAAAAGLPDVQTISLDRMLEVVASIVNAVGVPVTADMEQGYGNTPDEVARSIGRAAECGVAGVNIEDGTGDSARPLEAPEVLAGKVRAVRAADYDVVINARTDVFLVKALTLEEQIADAIARGNSYAAAGAECVFVPGGLDRDTIRRLVSGIDAPISVVANPAISKPVLPDIPDLADLGVARVSVGSGIMRATLAYTQRAAREVLSAGSYHVMRSELDHEDAPNAYLAAIGQAPTA